MRAALGLVAAVLVGALQAAQAQIAPPSGQAPSGVPDAAEACASCHGALGAGHPAAGIPRLAGLSPYYSARQLQSYANGTRRNPAMEAIARSLSPGDVNVVSTYFGQVDAPVAPSADPVARPGGAAPGRLLATRGSRALQVQACNNCHGPAGAGEPPAIPYLAGQGASYLVATLNAWRAGTRRNDAGDQMAPIARALSPEAIVAVAQYYSSLSAPPPTPPGMVRFPPPSGEPAAGLAAVRPRQGGADSTTGTMGRLPMVDLTDADPARGRAILASGVHGCAGCHAIPGIRGANGVVGPPLGGMAERGFIAGQLPNRPDVLVAFLIDPPALVPRTGMPQTGLTRDQALHVAAYLSTLER